ncbi:hypothetical protein L1987_45043 [Smallanthus sonchifolius]|uniref:Uncharacterized protein n=1 Tax=Smallanthus sonchifolius TaxID=185202 RepID=A0ACB9GR56_9ASTR|nr:hypothetical protein L1987_45043 [Smallanthus sonchifolius]
MLNIRWLSLPTITPILPPITLAITASVSAPVSVVTTSLSSFVSHTGCPNLHRPRTSLGPDILQTLQVYKLIRDNVLISDLVAIIVSAAIGGIICSCLGQPVIVGYLFAGSLVGPGGLKYVSEMVQVETFAQFGVVFLLFALGLEFSMPKLKDVGPVALLGGLLQILILMFLCGTMAMLCGAEMSEGVFVGCFLSMSSTTVVSGGESFG